jgi:hypothetical protein
MSKLKESLQIVSRQQRDDCCRRWVGVSLPEKDEKAAWMERGLVSGETFHVGDSLTKAEVHPATDLPNHTTIQSKSGGCGRHLQRFHNAREEVVAGLATLILPRSVRIAILKPTYRLSMPVDCDR